METAKRAAARLGDRRSVGFTAAILRGFLFSLLTGGAFLLFFSILLYRSGDPTRLALPASLGATAILALLGGYSAGRRHRQSGALCGLTVGLLTTFLFLLVALVIKTGSLPAHSLPLYFGIPALSTLGGFMATRKRRHSRRRKRAR